MAIYSVILVKTGPKIVLYIGGEVLLRSRLGAPRGNIRVFQIRLEPGVLGKPVCIHTHRHITPKQAYLHTHRRKPSEKFEVESRIKVDFLQVDDP